MKYLLELFYIRNFLQTRNSLIKLNHALPSKSFLY